MLSLVKFNVSLPLLPLHQQIYFNWFLKAEKVLSGYWQIAWVNVLAVVCL